MRADVERLAQPEDAHGPAADHGLAQQFGAILQRRARGELVRLAGLDAPARVVDLRGFVPLHAGRAHGSERLARDGPERLGPEVVERRRRRWERLFWLVVREELVFLLLREFHVGELVGERDRLGVGQLFGCCGFELF